MLGNIRFIGELYKESMLTERIMHECIKKLIGEFQHPEEENVEALCKLMSTIGHMIDHAKAKEFIDAYFDRMTKMSNNQGLPSRLRFMLRDIIDLRKNGWHQRRKVEGPKKIEEVHRDAVQELQVQGGRLSRNPNVGHSGRRLPTPDRSFRSPATQHHFPGAQMGSLQHIGGMRGVQPQVGTHGFNSQDSRFA
jgi:translation initiation factor 4G